MPYDETYRKTPNHGRGVNERRGCVFHHTAGTYAGSVAWLTDPRSKASAHVVIAKDGRRTVLAEDHVVTWHAGKSEWRGRRGCNAFTLGVEFELTTADVEADMPLTNDQLDSMLEWLAPRWHEYGWTLADMTHHREIAPGRKVDLSPQNWLRVKTAIAARFGVGSRVPIRPLA